MGRLTDMITNNYMERRAIFDVTQDDPERKGFAHRLYKVACKMPPYILLYY